MAGSAKSDRSGAIASERIDGRLTTGVTPSAKIRAAIETSAPAFGARAAGRSSSASPPCSLAYGRCAKGRYQARPGATAIERPMRFARSGVMIGGASASRIVSVSKAKVTAARAAAITSATSAGVSAMR